MCPNDHFDPLQYVQMIILIHFEVSKTIILIQLQRFEALTEYFCYISKMDQNFLINEDALYQTEMDQKFWFKYSPFTLSSV